MQTGDMLMGLPVVVNDASIEGPLSEMSGLSTGSGGRFVVLKITPEVLVSFFTSEGPRTLEVTSGRLPADSRIVETTWGMAGLCVCVILQSEEFAEVLPGGDIPLWPLIEMRIVPTE